MARHLVRAGARPSTPAHPAQLACDRGSHAVAAFLSVFFAHRAGARLLAADRRDLLPLNPCCGRAMSLRPTVANWGFNLVVAVGRRSSTSFAGGFGPSAGAPFLPLRPC